MSYHADVKYSRQIIERAIRQLWWRWSFPRLLLGAGVLVFGFSLWFLYEARDWATATLISVTAVLLVMEAAVFFVYRRRSLDVFRKMESPTARWEFDDDFLSVRADTGNARVRWRIVKELWRLPEALIFMYVNRTISILPREALTPETEAFIVRKVLENNGKVHEKRKTAGSVNDGAGKEG